LKGITLICKKNKIHGYKKISLITFLPHHVTSLLNTCFVKRKAHTKTPLEIYFIYSDNIFTAFLRKAA